MHYVRSTPKAVEFYVSAFKKFRTRFNECFVEKSETMSISIDDLSAD